MLLSTRDIRVTLLGEEGPFDAVDGVSFDLRSGDMLDITGPSGAGKSTLLHTLAMQQVTWTGEMFLRGEPSTEFTPTQWRRRVALVQQKPIMTAGTVYDNLTLPWTFKAYQGESPPAPEELEVALESARLTGISLDRSVERLSVGQQARVAFLRTLLTDPDVLLLDEADAALDDESAEAIGVMTSSFVGADKGAIRVRHRADDGRASAFLHMERGRVVSG